MSVAQLKSALFSMWHRQGKDDGYESGLESETFGSKVRRAYQEGKFDDQIQKAEIDYREGRALDKLY